MQKTVITNKCIFCAHLYSVTINTADLKKWQSGQLIQNAMPDVPAHDREFLISKICPNCQDNLPEPK